MGVSATLKTCLTALGAPPTFPSGHTLGVTVFYGGLVTHLLPGTKERTVLGVGLIFYGWALWFKGYHTFFDIGAAVILGASLLVFYNRLRQALGGSVGWMGFTLWLMLVPCLIILGLVASILAHVWMAFYALLGLSTASLTRAVPIPGRSMVYRLWFVGSFGVVMWSVGFFVAWSTPFMPLALTSLPWLLVGYLVPLWPVLCVGHWRRIHVEWAP